jgi:hypothetical protein
MNIVNISPALYDFDIFARRICLFYKKNEKIGSEFGLILTIIYILSSITIFILFFIMIYQKRDFNVSDSIIHSQTIPSFNLNTSNLYFFIIGITHKNNTRFIDESIYRVSAIYTKQYKDSNGVFVNKEIKNLQVEKCNKNYSNEILNQNELNNYYCIENLNIDLIGGKNYKNFSFLEIQINQCINNSDNNNMCKSQEIIDDALENGHFTIQLKNTELNPDDYAYPIQPTIQEFFSSISKNFYKNIYFMYKITKVETYNGIFYGIDNVVEDLKLDDTKEEIYYMNNNEKIISKINIKLTDGIHIQKRIYKNIFNVFAVTGGYMNILFCLFYLMSFIYNKFKFEKIIVNCLMNLDLKYEKKIPPKINLKRNSTAFLNNFSKDLEKKSLQESKKIDNYQSEKRNFPIKSIQRRSVCIENIFHFKSKKSINIPLIHDNAQFSFMDQSNNASRAEIIQRPSELKLLNKKNFGDHSMNFGDQSLNVSINKSMNKSINKSMNKSINKSINKSLNRSLHRNIHNHIKLERKYSIFADNSKRKKVKDVNIFDFYFGKFLNKKKELEFLNKCSSFYKERMDLINLFKVQLIFENFFKSSFLSEKNGLNEEIKMISNKKNNINV